MSEEETTSNNIKNTARNYWDQYAVWIFLILTIILAYNLYNNERILLDVNGTQLIIILLILGFGIYYFSKTAEKPVIPTKDKLALELANWYYEAGYGYLDYTECEVQIISEEQAFVYVPSLEKTYLYIAGRGIMGERWKDIEESIMDNETSSLLKNFQDSLAKKTSLKAKLENKGIKVVE